MLTGADFQDEVGKGGDTCELSRQAAQDAIYTSSIFKRSGTACVGIASWIPKGSFINGLYSADEERTAQWHARR